LKYMTWTNWLWHWLTEKTWPTGKYPPETSHKYYPYFNDGWHRIFREMDVQTSKEYIEYRESRRKLLMLINTGDHT